MDDAIKLKLLCPLWDDGGEEVTDNIVLSKGKNCIMYQMDS